MDRSSRARSTTTDPLDPSTTDDAAAATGEHRPARRRRRVRPGLVAAFGAAFVAGTSLGVVGVVPSSGGGDGEAVLAQGAAVDLSGSTAEAAETLEATREDGQASRSQNRDAEPITEFGAQRRASLQAQQREAEAAERTEQAAAADAARVAALAAAEEEAQRVAALEAALADPQETGRAMAAERGWTGEQFQCLDSLWTKESDWTPTADNPTSDAYGIPQSLPGEKMAEAGDDWATNPITQISWGLTYIRDVYGTPCGAWAHSQATDWY